MNERIWVAPGSGNAVPPTCWADAYWPPEATAAACKAWNLTLDTIDIPISATAQSLEEPAQLA